MEFDQRAFVRAVRERLGITPTDLGKVLGKPNAYNSVNSWETTTQKNYRKLSFTDTMMLLRLCGWLSMDSDALEAAAIPPDPLAQLGAGIERILLNQQEILRRLPAPSEQSDVRVSPKPKGKPA